MKRAAFVFLAAMAVPVPAQIQEDPKQRMQEILNEVAEQMTQIDKWLQESSRSKEAAREGMKKNVENLDKLLDSVGKSQEQVVKGIDELLKEAQKMQGKSSDGC